MCLTPDLKRKLAEPGAKTSVVIRLAPGMAYEKVRADIELLGVNVRSGGPGGIVAVVNAAQADQVASTKGVVSIDLPKPQNFRSKPWR